MSKIIFNKIVAKLERLDEYLRYLREIQKVNKKSFIKDYHFYGLAERYLQLSIEIILDIGKLIILAKNFRKPEDNQEVFAVLCENMVIQKQNLKYFFGMANFRNILVHDYEKIDREIIYKKLHENLDSFVLFKKSVLKFLKKFF
ncbi:DUF86 domain-containing protein [Candidatus Peregrinibacteria bacterium]|nr:DUF86 domain-containing protein [Candidatus Peregrinibacteria bacterium]